MVSVGQLHGTAHRSLTGRRVLDARPGRRIPRFPTPGGAALGRPARLGKLRPQVHVQADGDASGTGADLDQIADLLDDPQPAAAPGRDRIPS